MEDMEQYKSKVKKNIENLINSNNLKDAKKIIKEYEKLVDNDADIYSFEGVIAMVEGKLDVAEKILKEGILIRPISLDLLYNLAHLYEMQEKYKEAYRYYDKAFIVANEQTKDHIKDKIANLENIEEIKKYKSDEIDDIVTERMMIKMKKQIAELQVLS
ncbi:hypothetical protein N493_13115 [Clostridium botulinum B2 433]|uniref:tetratricopeptide repeat protein n=1 Tax=Clostridium botulinum TaxID=1491 RepID=UPI0007E26961|nr:hypothetical protein [Clostridium botulinum]KEI90378.1 hypothetical protein N493_13115 [Clostridium botulinum B2 433]